MSAGLIPYSPHGEEPRHSQKAHENPEIEGAKFQGVEARRAADRAGAGGTAQSRDQPRRCRARFRTPDCSRRRTIPGTAAPAAKPPRIARGRRRGASGMWRSAMPLDTSRASPPPTLRRERGGSGVGGEAEYVEKSQPASPLPLAGEGQGGGASANAGPGFAESPQREFAPANYGTSATIPTLDPELAKQFGFTTEEEDARRDGAAAAQQDGGARRRRHRRRAGKPDPRRPPRVQGRGRPDQDLDAAPSAAPGEIRRRRPLRDQVRIRAEGRPAHRDQGTGRGHQPQRPHPGAARRHRLRQDLHHGQGDRGHAAPGDHPGAEQDAGGAALWRVQELLPRQRRGVFRQLLRLLPARGLRAAHRHLYREGFVDQRADRPHAPFGDAGAVGARRRHHRRLGVVHLRYRLGRDLHRDDVCAEEGRAHRPAAIDRRSGGAAVQAHPGRFHPRHLSRARRRHRHLPGAL